MYLLYSAALLFGIIVMMPKFVWDGLRYGKYFAGLSQRLGYSPITTNTGEVVWLHCVSVGETAAAQSIVLELIRKHPERPIVVSTTTVTGQRVAKELFGERVQSVFYFPLDLPWFVRRAIARVKPAAVLLMETELWPNFLREANRQGLPVAIINGRISPNSFRRYTRVAAFIGRVLSGVSVFAMQDHGDAERVIALGADQKRVRVTGNIKFDIATSTNPVLSPSTEIIERFQFSTDRPVIVAASTHRPEEAVLIDTYRLLGHQNHTIIPRLVIAPRHPERFAEVAKLIETAGFTWCRRSNSPMPSDANCDIILLDSIGELRTAFINADLVFVGGSIARHGGHNVLEPAASNVAVITGPHTHNFSAIISMLHQRNALIQLPELNERDYPSTLAAQINSLLRDATERQRIAKAARQVLDENRGATLRTVEAITPILDRVFSHPREPALSTLPREPVSSR